jgi:hypothetical protein
MPLQDDLTHAAKVARWKADQQLRLMKIQNQIRDIEGEIRSRKSLLAEQTFALYARDGLVEEELKQTCSQINDLQTKIQENQMLQEAVKNELPPEKPVHPVYQPAPAPAPSEAGGSQLVCPKCGRVVPVRFCPDHGVEGVPAWSFSGGQAEG